MTEADSKATERPDPVDAWLSGMDSWRDYLCECARAPSAEAWLDAYGRFLSRCYALAGDYLQAIGGRPLK